MKWKFIIFFLMLFNTSVYCQFKKVFLIDNNKIILQISTRENRKLNFLFDTGTNELLVDSTVASECKLIGVDSKKGKTQFENGTAAIIPFATNTFFKDDFFNQVYKYGNAINMHHVNLTGKIPIHGIIGINKALEKFVVDLDFINNEITFSSESKKSDLNNAYLFKLIYTDNGHENLLSKYYHQLSCIEVNFCITDKFFVRTNVLIDTGCTGEFVLNSSSNIDSLVQIIHKPFTVKQKRVGLGDSMLKQFCFQADSIVIGDLIDRKRKIYLAKIDKGTMQSYGNIETSGLMGVPFLKLFKTITLDYSRREVIFKK